ncbi:MAG: type II restriction endonuclease [Candidatus Diapherotrites archaeon]|nr:type II restriction endonuclease [Candidatus Diapherotrites archaeon]
MIFDYFMSSLTESIVTWDYFVDFEKVKKNVVAVEKELNLLNVLIGKKDIEREFIDLIMEYPKVRNVLPILIAIRNNKLKDLKITTDLENLTSEDVHVLFDPKINVAGKNQQLLLKFFRDSGLKEILMDKTVKNLVDYCFGVEVGMDTNARKNRTGSLMEKIVEGQIGKFCKKNGIQYCPQATKSKIKSLWGVDVELDKTNRIFDLAAYNNTTHKLFLFETNFYGGGGSKLKSTAGEYQYLNDFLGKQGISLIWITDGLGWTAAKKPLQETFVHNEYVFNLDLIKKGVLKEVLL